MNIDKSGQNCYCQANAVRETLTNEKKQRSSEMSILKRIGNTPLVRYQGDVPNGNHIWMKLECKNPWGSHYDRVYQALFDHLETSGRLSPGATILETTSGSAGISFAGIGRVRGYICKVAIPGGGERARERAIISEGAELIRTPADAYVSGFPAFLRRYLLDHSDTIFLNHSMGRRGAENTVTTSSLAEIATEVLREVGDGVDFYVGALGNGSSVLGPGRVFRQAGADVVTFESFQSGVGYDLLWPGRYKREFGIDPGSLPRHRLPGTSFQGISFPHIRIAFGSGLVSRAVLVSDELTDRQYTNMTGRTDTTSLPHWDTREVAPYGRTTQAGLATALRLADKVYDKNIVIIAYDKADRYDS